jgi:hypothetical protein
MPSRFIEPCLPSPAVRLQLDSRDQARRLPAHGPARPCRHTAHHAQRQRLDDPLPADCEAVNHLKVRSCLIDGEVVCCDEKGVAASQLLRHRRNEPQAFLYAFDLLELNGADPRREPIEGSQGDVGEHPAAGSGTGCA